MKVQIATYVLTSTPPDSPKRYVATCRPFSWGNHGSLWRIAATPEEAERLLLDALPAFIAENFRELRVKEVEVPGF